MDMISINEFLSRVDLRTVAYIEPVSGDRHCGSMLDGPDAPASAIRFIGGSTLLCGQSLDYFRALAHGRMLAVSVSTKADQARLVPLDAIHHFEIDPEAEHLSTPEQDDHLPKAKIVYRAYDPAHPERRFQMLVAASVIDDLLDRDTASIIAIGRGKFVFADEIEDARPLKAWQIMRFANVPNAQDALCEPPVTIVSLSGGEFIPSSFYARTIEGMLGRPLPSACAPRFRHDAYREAGLSA